MDVNSIFSQIGNFWDSISIPIVFHIIFFALYKFIFRGKSIKVKVSEYAQGQKFENTKALLEKFELWKKLPIILLFAGLIYLTVFNSITNFVNSVSIFPFGITYSNEDFIQEYEPREDIVTISSYRRDTIPTLLELVEFNNRLLEEYKIKYPDNYGSWFNWTNENINEKMKYVSLLTICILILVYCFLINFFKKNWKTRLIMSFRLLIVLLFAMPALLILRYRGEQVLEEQFANQVIFVKNSLESDVQRKPVLTTNQMIQLKSHLFHEFNGVLMNPDMLWVSRYVSEHKWMEAVLGNRRLISRNP